MSNHDPLDELFGPQDDPRVDAALRAIGDRLLEAPDDLTARRHRRAMAAARPVGIRQVVQRTAVAGVAAAVAAFALAVGGLLPGPAQEVVADLASLVGLDLPRPEPSGDVVGEPTPSGSTVEEIPDGGEAPSTPVPPVPTPSAPGEGSPPPNPAAPGDTDERPDDTDGRLSEAPDRSGHRPARPDETPGRSDDAPGRSGEAPGRPAA
ncbi:MAG: hypothetical protein WD378_02595, partial [Egicoccus sp.]